MGVLKLIKVFAVVFFLGLIASLAWPFYGLNFPPEEPVALVYYVGVTVWIFRLSISTLRRGPEEMWSQMELAERKGYVLMLVALTILGIELARSITQPLVELSTTPRLAIAEPLSQLSSIRVELNLDCRGNGQFSDSGGATRQFKPSKAVFERGYEGSHVRLRPVRILNTRSAIIEFEVTKQLTDYTSRGPVRWAMELFTGNLDIYPGEKILLHAQCVEVEGYPNRLNWSITGTVSRKHLSWLSGYLGFPS